ncbi:MAG: plasmid stabilization protein [Armatimonadetes bacterium]|nr:plasmid stabilization protein [Armatimonadota bacterium]
MPQGDKSKYTEKQKRQAEHIEDGYREEGIREKDAERRAWATVNKLSGGGRKPGGSGYGKTKSSPSHSAKQKGGSQQTSTSRSEAAKKGWETRRRKAHQRSKTA